MKTNLVKRLYTKWEIIQKNAYYDINISLIVFKIYDYDTNNF